MKTIRQQLNNASHEDLVAGLDLLVALVYDLTCDVVVLQHKVERLEKAARRSEY
jgi:hypothetical protein